MSRSAILPSGIYDLPFADLERQIAESGLARIHARALWRALYRESERALPARDDFVAPLQRWCDDSRCPSNGPAFFSRPELAGQVSSSDGLTEKFLLRLGDGQTVETVLMGYPGRMTACVSTQAGCAMGCVFCATGQMGFARHLRPAEIVTQVLHAQEAAHGKTAPGLRNLVLMGMGEPLHNYDAVMTALEIISDTRGLNLGPSRITISTVGVIPGIVRLAEEKRPYRLAVSLHGSTEEERSALVPISRRWPLAELIAACRYYGRQTGHKIFFEWTLIAGANDSPAHAARLAALLAGIEAHVNLIPLNPTGGFSGSPSDRTSATEFQRTLRAAGIPSTVRQRRGIDVAAGCGQLRAERPVA
ncbi:MAG: 23S rRNA (adenine(2503)-C(2))-methyltransferase RlmN [Chthoniobacteraceae bacterium]